MSLFSIIRRTPAFYIALFLLWIAAGLLLLFYSANETTLFINGLYSPAADFFFHYWTYVGDGAFYVIVCLILFGASRWYGWMGLLSFAFSSLLSLFLKRVVFPGAPRPKAVFTEPSQLHYVEGVDVFLGNSFPSGHTITAFSLAVLLAYLVPRRGLSLIFLLMAVLVGYSRIYLAQHFFGDVLAGSIGGVVTTWMAIGLTEWWKRRLEKRRTPLSEGVR